MRMRITFDGVTDRPLSIEEIEKLKQDVRAHMGFTVLPSYEDDSRTFDVDEINITAHNHESTRYESCQHCYSALAGDELS